MDGEKVDVEEAKEKEKGRRVNKPLIIGRVFSTIKQIKKRKNLQWS